MYTTTVMKTWPGKSFPMMHDVWYHYDEDEDKDDFDVE